jgi:hypothetical protein
MAIFQPEIKNLLRRFGRDPNSLSVQDLEVLCNCRLLEEKVSGHQLTPRGRDILGMWETP